MFYNPFLAMQYLYDELSVPGDPAYSDIDEGTKFALFDLVVYSPEAQAAAHSTITF